MFTKAESYLDFKHARAINSRSDRFKVEVGPFFHLIEQKLFKLPWFIKRIPAPLRAKYVFDMLNAAGAEYEGSDYTSFEALFTSEIMEAAEFQLYDWVVEPHPRGKEFMSTIKTYLGGVNRIVNKYMTVEVDATRMSGEMCTSLGNGFSNLMFMLFIAEECGCDVTGIVEGDDGLFRLAIRPGGHRPTADDFAKLGLVIKLEHHAQLNTASFCGQVFDTATFTVVTDPKKVLASFGWIDGKFACSTRNKKLSMLRAKAWSIGYQYPACPVLSSLSRAYLRLTRSIDHRTVLQDRNLDSYKRAEYVEAFDAGRPELNLPIDPETRAIMEAAFGFPSDLQRLYEDYFDNLQRIEEIPLWFDAPEPWVRFSSKYVITTRYPQLLSDPPEAWRRCYPTPLPPELDHPVYQAEFAVT
jgi:hypothetical protein